MRAVIQRVTGAELTVNGAYRGRIHQGFVVLVGVCHDDTDEDAIWLAHKIASLRVFGDDAGVMNRDLNALGPGAGLMVVSQFTLYASYKKGNRPSWIHAATHDVAVPLYELFCRRLQAEAGCEMVTGDFGADMQIALVNDGPVTICMDTKNKE
ncbi:MAG: D-tyrosyl-tRNA(Tyr) deacylase [Prevotella sp.]|nr:D-tyrosyl-tRNA(Tyr) deacylase [Prevotella sp.]